MKVWPLLILLTLPVTGICQSRVFFGDSCSGKESKVITPNGLKLMLRLEKLSPDKTVKVRVTMRPAVIPELLKKQDSAIWNLQYGTARENWLGRTLVRVSSEGILETSILLPKKNWMRKIETRHNGYRIWDAEVTWSQDGTRNSGNLVTSFYHAEDEGPYFQVLSQNICHFESPAEVDSKLYQNTGPHTMNISRSVDLSWEQGLTRGLTLGYNNFQGTTNPLSQFSPSAALLGWLFKEWQSQTGTARTSGIERKYTLKLNEAAVFISRMSFNRHRARRFEWDQSAGECGNFVPVSEGILDVGRKNSGNLVIVPADYAARPELMSNFINRAVPAVSNCRAISGEGNPDDVILSGENGILYYYQRQTI